jgi:hypothetical protein
MVLAVLLTQTALFAASQQNAPAKDGVAVGPQFDTTHVYVSVADMDAFVTSFTATFGGQASKKSVTNVLPVPSSTEFQFVWTPVGALSVFAFETPIPFPFGQERTGYLVTDMNDAIKAARASGAEVLVAPFKDPIEMDAVVQWDGGVRTQLYWHPTLPSNGELSSVPENRVYVSPDRADEFARQFTQFAHGTTVSDDKKADAGEIGVPGGTYRRIRIESKFGKMEINVTDGHLPFPFGREVTGYEVKDLDATIAKARSAGVQVLWGPFRGNDRNAVILEFPGGYIAEVHALKSN